MAWLLAILVSTAVWIVSLLVRGSVSLDTIVWVLFFALVFWVPLLPILSVAAALARTVGKTFVVRSFLFYVIAVFASGSILALLYFALPHGGDLDAFSEILMPFLVPSLLASFAY